MVVDHKNTTGFQTDPETPPIVAIYTSYGNSEPHIQAQSLAISLDEGMTFEKFAGNPVLDEDSTSFRDPKVSWHEASQKWVMVAAHSNAQKVGFYGSKNLIDWEALSTFEIPEWGGVWECPALIKITQTY